MWKKAGIMCVLILVSCGPRMSSFKAVVTYIEGEVKVQRQGNIIEVHPGDSLRVNDIVRTGPSGIIDIKFSDDAGYRIESQSEIQLEKLLFNPDNNSFWIKVRIFIGTLLARIKKFDPFSKYEISTPTALGGVRGTTFLIDVVASATVAGVFKGSMEIQSIATGEKVTIGEKQKTVVEEGKSPTPPQALLQKDIERLKKAELIHFAVALETTKRVLFKAYLGEIQKYLDLYYAEKGQYPDNLKALISEGYLGKEYLLDEFGNPYRYEVRGGGTGYTLRGAGRDGAFNTPDDQVVTK